jgi:CrcB protein
MGMGIDFRSYTIVASGGFCGAVLRWFIDQQIPSLAGTLVVNIIGCFFLGIFMYESIYIGAFSRDTRIFFGAGAIGAFTTFSALAVQSFLAGPLFGLANLAANVVLGLIAVWFGRYFITYNRWT